MTLDWVGNPHWDVDEVHDVFRRWRAVANTYEGDRVFVAEAVVSSAGAVEQLPAARRDAQRLQLPVHEVGVGRRGAPNGDRRDTRPVRPDRRPRDVGHGEPRRGAAGHPLRPEDHVVGPLRRRPGRDLRPGTWHSSLPRGCSADAGPAWRRIHLSRRGAGSPAGRRPAGRGDPGPGVQAHQRRDPRPGRLPGATAVERRAAAVRVLAQRRTNLAAAACRLELADCREGVGGP